MVDIFDKDKEHMEKVIKTLERKGDADLKENGINENLFEDPFHKNAVDMGLLVKPPADFSSKYNILKEFLLAKKFEGCSSQTLRIYYDTIYNYLATLPDTETIFDTKTADIRKYLMYYKEDHQCSNITMDNMRRIFSSFYNWLEDEDYSIKNPVKKIKKIRYDSVIKKPFSSEEIESLKDACKNYRELALIEFLYSSGVRVSELCALDITDLNFNEREGIVYGKGGKERVFYFDVKTKIHLTRYINSRVDPNPSLFVTKKYPFNRLKKSGVECVLRDVGLRAKVDNVHPHRFRRTFATNLLDKGVPIEQVQVLLGHSKIDTTLIYANVNNQQVKLNHQRYI